MVLQASQALTITISNTRIQTDQELQREITETEQSIRRAGQKQKKYVRHNAQILGNPVDDPHVDENLTDQQIVYRDIMIDSGYVVSLDPETGLWKFDWSTVGIEQDATVYSIRTSIPVGAIAEKTENAIDAYFKTLEPIVTSKSQVVRLNGGNIDETEFGATYSEFYEFYTTVTQPDEFDHSDDLRLYLTMSGLGYNSSNMAVYKMVHKS